jgi:phenylpropionate dioxygenase-like ring-hydroxylating dioxygenase large terminal subunit
MLEGCWYIAGTSAAVRAGQPFASVLCNQPLVLFRDGRGRVHALEDRCPHKGVPLSSARQEGDSLRCPFHGWRFISSGECVEVPAIGHVAHPSSTSACVKTFPAEEQDGWVWVFIGHDRCPKPSSPPPSLPVPADGTPMVSVRESAEAKVRWDFAVDSLMDPAHVPFVHNNYFRRREAAKRKEKMFTRLPLGFRTVSQNVLLPDTFIFRALSPRLGSAVTTVDFVLPGIHMEQWEIGKRFASVMLVATPLTAERSRFDICVGWNFLRGFPVGWLIRRTLRTILGQDRNILELQEQGFGAKGSMLLNIDSDTPAVWYRRLKKYHLDQLTGAPNDQHPVPEKVTLSWTT